MKRQAHEVNRTRIPSKLSLSAHISCSTHLGSYRIWRPTIRMNTHLQRSNSPGVPETNTPANAGMWAEIARQVKQKRCHECSKRTYFWLFEAKGAICSGCVNRRTMPRPIPHSSSVGESTNGKKRKSTVAPTIKNAILAKRAVANLNSASPMKCTWPLEPCGTS